MSASTTARLAIRAVISAAIMTVAFLIVSSMLSSDSDSSGAKVTLRQPASAPTSAPAGETSSHHGNRGQTAGPTTAAERQMTAEHLELTRRKLSVTTVADALAAGYEVTNDQEGENDVHLARRNLIDGSFDPTQPEMLLAQSRAPAAKIIALVWWIEGATPDPPAGFPGGEDEWHQHKAYCIIDDKTVSLSVQECLTKGGDPVTEGGWMLHAWVIPEFENPEGTFVTDNPSLNR